MDFGRGSMGTLLMSALGHSRPSHRGPKSTFVRCYSNSRQTIAAQRMQRCANSGLMQRSKKKRYSITSSAMAITPDGMLKRRAFAVVRLREAAMNALAEVVPTTPRGAAALLDHLREQIELTRDPEGEWVAAILKNAASVLA
jgi:hypothetical protein